MKVIKKKTFEIEWVIPESKQEKDEIRKIIREVETKSEYLDPKSWTPIDNRKKPGS